MLQFHPVFPDLSSLCGLLQHRTTVHLTQGAAPLPELLPWLPASSLLIAWPAIALLSLTLCYHACYVLGFRLQPMC